MIVYLRIFLLGCVLAFGCVASKGFADDLFESLRLELSLIGSQIEDLRLNLLSPEVRSLAPADAGIALLRLDALEAKLRSTVGRVEALEFHLEILSKDATNRITEFNFKLQELESNAQASESDGMVNSGEEEVLSGSVDESSDETLAFDKALLNYNSSDFESALANFESFNKMYPESMNVAESYYWIGKSHNELRDFKAAASAFLDSFSSQPNGLFAWKSLLGLAGALDNLGQTEQGCLTLEELKSRFPKVIVSNKDEVQIVEEQLKCSL